MLTGVAGGLAERMDVDPSLVRVVWVLLAFLSGGIFALIYLVMAVVVPERPLGGAPQPQASYMAPPEATTGPPPEAEPGSWIGPDGQPASVAPEAGGRDGGSGDGQRSARPGTGAIILGGILILIGFWVLVVRYVPGLDAGTLWPIVAIVVGIGLVALAVIRPSGRR
jgi:phage shock protein PspC (stress-responsive transcriptional regulator)